MIKTQKFVRKPLFVDAVQVTEENFNQVVDWCQGDVSDTAGAPYIRVRVQKPLNVRQTQAYIGDWILYTDRGYKVYNKKAFRMNFDSVEECAKDESQLVVTD